MCKSFNNRLMSSLCHWKPCEPSLYVFNAEAENTTFDIQVSSSVPWSLDLYGSTGESSKTTIEIPGCFRFWDQVCNPKLPGGDSEWLYKEPRPFRGILKNPNNALQYFFSGNPSKITIDLSCLIPLDWVSFNDPCFCQRKNNRKRLALICEPSAWSPLTSSRQIKPNGR